MEEKLYKKSDIIAAFGRYMTDVDKILSTINCVEEIKNDPEIVTSEWEIVDNPFGGKTKAKQYGCKNCGKINREKSNFCPECGAKMETGD